MIRTILVALDIDTDTPVAIRQARDIAKRYDAEVTGLAVVDMGSIESGSRGGGIGSMYLVEELRKNLTTEARTKARQLADEFEALMKESDVPYDAHVKEGVPFRRILEDMKYHDLLVVGSEPHFFYSHPEQETKTLEHIVRDGVAPVFIVRDTYTPVERVLIAYDGSDAAARTLHRFVHLHPFGKDVTLEILGVYGKGKGAEQETELRLNLAKGYLEMHGFTARSRMLGGGNAADQIVDYAARFEADVVVAGAHSVSKLAEFTFGSTTSCLLKKSPAPLFIYK